jgi:hypothetical protein
MIDQTWIGNAQTRKSLKISPLLKYEFMIFTFCFFLWPFNYILRFMDNTRVMKFNMQFIAAGK